MPKSRVRIRRLKLQNQAEGYLELGMPKQAYDTLTRLGETDGADSQTFYLQGEALRAMHRYAEALVPFQKAAMAEPETTRAWLAMGWCHKRVGRIDQAIEALEIALTLDPEEPLIRYNLACYWSLGGGKRQALMYLEQALSLDPNYRLLIEHESDFDPIRSDPEFLAICERSQTAG